MTIDQILAEIEYPRIPAIAGTPDEDLLIRLWQWSIRAQVYARMAINQPHFNTETIQQDVKDIWEAALAWVDKRGGEATTIELFPHMLDHAMRLIDTIPAPVEGGAFETSDAEKIEVVAWARKGIFYMLWIKLDDPQPSADAINRLQIWVEGKIVRDFTSEALQDIRIFIMTSLRAMKNVLTGTLKVNFAESQHV